MSNGKNGKKVTKTKMTILWCNGGRSVEKGIVPMSRKKLLKSMQDYTEVLELTGPPEREDLYDNKEIKGGKIPKDAHALTMLLELPVPIGKGWVAFWGFNGKCDHKKVKA